MLLEAFGSEGGLIIFVCEREKDKKVLNKNSYSRFMVDDSSFLLFEIFQLLRY